MTSHKRSRTRQAVVLAVLLPVAFAAGALMLIVFVELWEFFSIMLERYVQIG